MGVHDLHVWICLLQNDGDFIKRLPSIVVIKISKVVIADRFDADEWLVALNHGLQSFCAREQLL